LPYAPANPLANQMGGGTIQSGGTNQQVVGQSTQASLFGVTQNQHPEQRSRTDYEESKGQTHQQ
jgi:hypothetical protein